VCWVFVVVVVVVAGGGGGGVCVCARALINKPSFHKSLSLSHTHTITTFSLLVFFNCCGGKVLGRDDGGKDIGERTNLLFVVLMEVRMAVGAIEKVAKEENLGSVAHKNI
jgi:hypothetical protein